MNRSVTERIASYTPLKEEKWRPPPPTNWQPPVEAVDQTIRRIKLKIRANDIKIARLKAEQEAAAKGGK